MHHGVRGPEEGKEGHLQHGHPQVGPHTLLENLRLSTQALAEELTLSLTTEKKTMVGQFNKSKDVFQERNCDSSHLLLSDNQVSWCTYCNFG